MLLNNKLSMLGIYLESFSKQRACKGFIHKGFS